MACKVILIVFIGVLIACSNAMKEKGKILSFQEERLAKIMDDIKDVLERCEKKKFEDNEHGNDEAFDCCVDLDMAGQSISDHLEKHDLPLWNAITEEILENLEPQKMEHDLEEQPLKRKVEIIQGCVEALKIAQKNVLGKYTKDSCDGKKGGKDEDEETVEVGDKIASGQPKKYSKTMDQSSTIIEITENIESIADLSLGEKRENFQDHRDQDAMKKKEKNDDKNY